MTDGAFFENGAITVVKDNRTTFNTRGKLINALPDAFATTVNVLFPDFAKGNAYYWKWESDFNSIQDQYGWISEGTSQITALPQEWSQVDTLASAPDGADLFWSRMRVNRTASPSAWISQPIDVQPPQNVWLMGSEAVIEAEFNMVRAFSIYLEGGFLKLWRSQTVGPASGGFGSAGNTSPASLTDTSGRIWHDFGSPGMPIYANGAAPYYKVSSGTTSIIPPYQHYQTHKWDGSDPASLADPTNYASTYQVDVYGKFARRS